MKGNAMMHPQMIAILNAVTDDFQNAGLTFDQATVAVVHQSILALAAALVDIAMQQGNAQEMYVSTEFISGLYDTAEWMNDRLELSRMPV